MAAVPEIAAVPKLATSGAESSKGIHRLLTLRRCPRLYAYRYILGLRSMGQKHFFALGSLVHKGLEYFYDGKNWRDRVQSSPSLSRDQAAEILERYLQTYAGEKIMVLAIEREFELALRGRIFTRRLDMVVKNKAGQIEVWDHKTASDVASRIREAELDPSLFTQELIGRAVLPDIFKLPYGHFVLNLIPTGAGKTDAESGFRRKRILFSRSILSDAPAAIGGLLQLEESYLRSGTDPWAYPTWWNCYERKGICDYRSLCLEGKPALNRFVLYEEQV